MSFFKNLFSGKPSEVNKPAQPATTQTREGVREKHFYKEYYDQMMTENVALHQQNLSLYEKLLNERGPNYDGHQTLEFQLADNLIVQLTIGYSRGDSVASLQSKYNEAVNYFIKSWNESVVYNDVLQFLS